MISGQRDDEILPPLNGNTIISGMKFCMLCTLNRSSACEDWRKKKRISLVVKSRTVGAKITASDGCSAVTEIENFACHIAALKLRLS